jgi:hypothetical protein
MTERRRGLVVTLFDLERERSEAEQHRRRLMQGAKNTEPIGNEWWYTDVDEGGVK